ncbi:hypothetical protein NMY22_g13682 [Coprinellus aureogranulatus]|nr:hypothetical protein NMY22_g13682 [Coprinellus aureogranulatus]
MTEVDLYGVPYRPALRKMFSVCYDIYLKLRSESETKVKRFLNHLGVWRRKNACPACTYELTEEEKLLFKILVAMDGNDSLKRILRRALDPSYEEDDDADDSPLAPTFGTQRDDPHEVDGDVYLTNAQVNEQASEDSGDLRTLEDDGNPCASRWRNMDADKTSMGLSWLCLTWFRAESCQSTLWLLQRLY